MSLVAIYSVEIAFVQLTYGFLGGHISGISHGVQDGPVAVDRDGHEAEDGDRAEDNQQRQSEQTRVQLVGETHFGQNRAWDS